LALSAGLAAQPAGNQHGAVMGFWGRGDDCNATSSRFAAAAERFNA
jgi:hypothetical protein